MFFCAFCIFVDDFFLSKEELQKDQVKIAQLGESRDTTIALSRDHTKLVLTRYYSKDEMEARANGLNAQIFELLKPAVIKLNKMYRPIVHPQLLKIMYGSSDEKRYAINTDLDYVVVDGKTQLCHLRRYYYSKGPAPVLKPGKAGVALLPSETLALFKLLPKYISNMRCEQEAAEEEEQTEEEEEEKDEAEEEDQEDLGEKYLSVSGYGYAPQSQPDFFMDDGSDGDDE